MDPRDRADAALARARARGAFVVTPDDAVSPMDAKNTQQIPRAVVNALDTSRQDSDTTMVISAGAARGHAAQQQPPEQPISPALLEETRTQPVQLPQQQNYRPEPQQPPAPEQPPAPRALDGLVPTVQQPANPRSSLSRRLDGGD